MSIIFWFTIDEDGTGGYEPPALQRIPGPSPLQMWITVPRASYLEYYGVPPTSPAIYQSNIMPTSPLALAAGSGLVSSLTPQGRIP